MARKGPPNTRVYGGKTYYLFTASLTRAGALKDAVRLRKNGYSARIHERRSSSQQDGHELWFVYSNPKTPKWYSGAYLTKLKK